VPTWGEILAELQASAAGNNGQPDFDSVRRKYLDQLHKLTGRNTIIYYTDWLQTSGEVVSITLEDMQGMMEVMKGLRGPNLDLLLHSPGGSPEAARSIVQYLRSRFSHIRAFVPLAAMSAATMWALACDEIVMGQHSQLGPIDPQLLTLGGAVPARAIIEQFDQARKELKADPAALPAWLPILQQYAPALLKQCETAEALSRRLVREWLVAYMLRGQPDARKKAADIARYFGAYSLHQSHGMGISREDARSRGVNVGDLETDPSLQDAVLSVHHAAMHTLGGAAVKLVENHLGKTFAKLQQLMQVQVPVIQPGPMPIPGGMQPVAGAPPRQV
jgi:hypothetical protein